MQLTLSLESKIAELEEKWHNATHHEEKHYYYTIAAQLCQDNRRRLQVQGSRWAIAQQMDHRGSGR